MVQKKKSKMSKVNRPTKINKKSPGPYLYESQDPGLLSGNVGHGLTNKLMQHVVPCVHEADHQTGREHIRLGLQTPLYFLLRLGDSLGALFLQEQLPHLWSTVFRSPVGHLCWITRHPSGSEIPDLQSELTTLVLHNKHVLSCRQKNVESQQYDVVIS